MSTFLLYNIINLYVKKNFWKLLDKLSCWYLLYLVTKKGFLSQALEGRFKGQKHSYKGAGSRSSEVPLFLKTLRPFVLIPSLAFVASTNPLLPTPIISVHLFSRPWFLDSRASSIQFFRDSWSSSKSLIWNSAIAFAVSIGLYLLGGCSISL